MKSKINGIAVVAACALASGLIATKPAFAVVTYDFTQTFGNIQIAGTLTFSGNVPDSITVDALNADAVWSLAFSTAVPDPVFPLAPFTLDDSDSSWTTELISGTSLEINATEDELVFDFDTPLGTNAAVVLASDGPDFRQFRFLQVNQPGFQGTQMLIQGVDIAGDFFNFPLDTNLVFPAAGVSEPTTVFLLAGGVLGLVGCARRRRP